MEKTGALVSRAAGVILIVIAASTLLSWPIAAPSKMASAGWTSYSPITTNVAQELTDELHLHDSYYIAAMPADFYLPSLVQAAAGLAMIIFSRPIGRWLARGLSDKDTR